MAMCLGCLRGLARVGDSLPLLKEFLDLVSTPDVGILAQLDRGRKAPLLNPPSQRHPVREDVEPDQVPESQTLKFFAFLFCAHLSTLASDNSRLIEKREFLGEDFFSDLGEAILEGS